MAETHIGSVAFRQAHLKSERLRLIAVLVAIGIAFLFRTVRVLIHTGGENVSLWLVTLGLLVPFAAYELLLLAKVNSAYQQQHELPGWTWIVNVIVENALPALGIILIASPAIDPSYRALAHPSVLSFFLFIILSTLRLNPTLCRLSGVVAASSYLFAAAWVGWRPNLAGHTSLLSPQKVVFNYAIEFIGGGFVAGLVAHEIRKQIDAALKEAETRRQLDRVQHDLEVARSIQQSLLPKSMPQIAGYEIAAWNQPADQTGGDYYDWQFLPGGRVVLGLADVTGHGIGPALLAAVCRAYARASFKSGNGLLAAMGELNSALAADIGEGRFVTLVAAICAPDSSNVEILSAGHGPLLLYKVSHDRIEQTDSQALPLGLLPHLTSAPPVVLELDRGDLLVLATDGFFEWANSKQELFGAQRFGEVMRQSKDKPARELISDLYQAVIEFAGGTPQQDDLTAVIIKRL